MKIADSNHDGLNKVQAVENTIYKPVDLADSCELIKTKSVIKTVETLYKLNGVTALYVYINAEGEYKEIYITYSLYVNHKSIFFKLKPLENLE